MLRIRNHSVSTFWGTFFQSANVHIYVHLFLSIKGIVFIYHSALTFLLSLLYFIFYSSASKLLYLFCGMHVCLARCSSNINFCVKSSPKPLTCRLSSVPLYSIYVPPSELLLHCHVIMGCEKYFTHLVTFHA